MKTYAEEELQEIFNQHKLWLQDQDGKRADLSGANLIGANLRRAYLSGANLIGANLRSAYLRSADLSSADLSGANLIGANLRSANLRSANLRSADLSGANLIGANLYGAIGNLRHIKSLQSEKYCVTYTSEILQIGCQRHTIEEWKTFDDTKITNMDSGALEWWGKWKPIIFKIIEISPAQPTGYVEEEK